MLLGVGAARADEKSVKPQLALVADLEGDVAVQRQVETAPGVELLAALDGDRSIAVERAEEVKSGSAVLKSRNIVRKGFLASELRIVPLLSVNRE